MKHFNHTLMSTVAASVLLGMSFGVAAGDAAMGSAASTAPGLSQDLRDSVYQLARDHEVSRTMPMSGESRMGQAGRAGPEQVPMGKTHAANAGDIRFSIYDQPQSASW